MADAQKPDTLSSAKRIKGIVDEEKGQAFVVIPFFTAPIAFAFAVAVYGLYLRCGLNEIVDVETLVLAICALFVGSMSWCACLELWKMWRAKARIVLFFSAPIGKSQDSEFYRSGGFALAEAMPILDLETVSKPLKAGNGNDDK